MNNSEKTFVTDLITEPDNINTIVEETTSTIENKIEQLPFSNREQRRAFMKKFGKTGETISGTAKKFAYIDLIQKLRKLNEKENGKNEQATKD